MWYGRRELTVCGCPMRPWWFQRKSRVASRSADYQIWLYTVHLFNIHIYIVKDKLSSFIYCAVNSMIVKSVLSNPVTHP